MKGFFAIILLALPAVTLAYSESSNHHGYNVASRNYRLDRRNYGSGTATFKHSRAQASLHQNYRRGETEAQKKERLQKEKEKAAEALKIAQSTLHHMASQSDPSQAARDRSVTPETPTHLRPNTPHFGETANSARGRAPRPPSPTQGAPHPTSP